MSANPHEVRSLAGMPTRYEIHRVWSTGRSELAGWGSSQREVALLVADLNRNVHDGYTYKVLAAACPTGVSA